MSLWHQIVANWHANLGELWGESVGLANVTANLTYDQLEGKINWDHLLVTASPLGIQSQGILDIFSSGNSCNVYFHSDLWPTYLRIHAELISVNNLYLLYVWNTFVITPCICLFNCVLSHIYHRLVVSCGQKFIRIFDKYFFYSKKGRDAKRKQIQTCDTFICLLW